MIILDAPEVISSDGTLEACTDASVAIVLAEFDGLIHATVAITKVRALGVAKVDT